MHVDLSKVLQDFVRPSQLSKNALEALGEARLAVGDCIALMDAPGDDGCWVEESTRCSVDKHEFSLDPELDLIADDYRSRHSGETDNVKYCLRKMSASFTDDPMLRVVLMRTKWSDVRALQEELDNPRRWLDDRQQSIRDRYGGILLDIQRTPIPSICCIHVVAVTRDGYLVAARRSENVEYYPSTWAVSYEENLSAADVDYGDVALFRAAKRGGDEEFFERGADVIDQKTIRLLSVFNEIDILNVTVCAVVEIPCTLADMCKRLPQARDKEARKIEGIPNDLDVVCGQIVRPQFEMGTTAGVWHPSSQYRLLTYALFRWPVASAISALEKASQRGPATIPRSRISCSLGTDVDTRVEVRWDPGEEQLPSLNVVAVGKPGTGKSNLLQKFVVGVAELGGRIVCLDFSGDFSNPNFTASAKLQHVSVRDNLRLNPFASSDDPLDLSSRMTEALQEPFGLDAGLRARMQVSLLNFLKLGRGATFQRFLETLEKSANENDRELYTRLFVLWGYGKGVFAGSESLADILDRGSVVFDFQGLIQGAREHDPVSISLANYIFLRADMLARSLPQCDDLRFLFLVDEAHRIKPVHILDTVASEGRKFGVSLVLGSQRAEHFRKEVLGTVPAFFLFTIDANDARDILERVVGRSDVESLTDYVLQQPRYYCLYVRQGSATKVHISKTELAKYVGKTT